MFDDYRNPDNLTNELRILLASNQNDFDETIKKLRKIKNTNLENITKKYKNIYELKELSEELKELSVFLNIVLKNFEYEEKEKFLKKWFHENFKSVKYGNIVRRLCHWHEIYPSDNDIAVLPPHLYEVVSRDETTVIDSLVDSHIRANELADETGIRFFSDYETDALYIGSNEPYDVWLETLYSAVYTQEPESDTDTAD